ncbi:MAG TPA: bifunctional phosphoglucose/phosphomannose isomerase [candidate division Zixibacteria bacterium]|nr:bifunctional phosphoglucose/phosphomannose isomerase [candidate division Zixibacteria bacterium]
MADILALKETFDKGDMYGLIKAMPQNLEEGIKLGRDANLMRLEQETFHSVVVAGMGGSAIAGDIARSYLYRQIQIPFVVCRYYRLPAFVNRKSLVICCSYSGNTEETLSAYDDAIVTGAHIIAITSGGKLAHKAESDGVPIVKIKGGLPPRAALGYSIAPLLMILERLGLCEEQSEALSQTALQLKNWAALYDPADDKNPALDLARQIYGTIPVIYSGYERLNAVATRFKGQLSENAKILAFTNVFPEQNHNELVGWHKLYDLDKKYTVVILKDSQEHKRIRARMEIVMQYLRDKSIKVILLENLSGQDLDRVFYFIQYLDFTSYYLALLNGVDPTPVNAIDYLKEKLAN